MNNGSASDGLGTPNFTLADLVFVYDYNGNSADDFQVFYSDRAPGDAVIQALIYGTVRKVP